MTIAKNTIPVMPEFPPVIVRDNMLCLDGGDDGKMIWDLMLAVNEAVNSNLTLADAIRAARKATEWDTGVQPPIRAVIDMYRFVTRNQKGETR